MNERVKLNVFYPYPVEKVWQALTDSRILSIWMTDNDFEPHVGHKFKFKSQSLPGIKSIIHCEVIELNEPNRLVYTWQDEITSEPSLVVWTLTAVEDGTQLQLKHLPTGYATTLGDRSSNYKQAGTYPGLFSHDRKPTFNSNRQVVKGELSGLGDRQYLKDNWDYRLNHRLPEALIS